MLNQCPACEKTTGMEIIHRLQDFEIKGEKVTIETSLYHCKECDSEFSAKELEDPFKAAYDKYRQQKRMVQPEEIVKFRKKYGLTQKELSDLLGFGGITLSRYENGALQDQAHDHILRLTMEPGNFIELILQNPSFTNDQKWKSVLFQLHEELSLIEQVDMLFNKTQPDEYNGFTPLKINKVADVIKYFCYNRNIYKTKLMKLLFYSDFIHFKNYKHSITGLRYAHLPYGPVPDGYELILGAVLKLDPNIKLEPVDFGEYSGELVKIVDPPTFENLSKTELDVLKNVSSEFEYFSSKAISIKSHKESAYKGTNSSELISYIFADGMSLQ